MDIGENAVIFSLTQSPKHHSILPIRQQQTTSLIQSTTYATIPAQLFPSASIIINPYNQYDDVKLHTTIKSLVVRTHYTTIQGVFNHPLNIIHPSVVKVTPDLRSNYSHERTMTAVHEVLSDTTSSGYTLTGTVSAAVVNSLLGIDLTDQADITQKATNPKHRITTTKLADGVASILGSDISPLLQPLCEIKPQRSDAFVWRHRQTIQPLPRAAGSTVPTTGKMPIFFSEYTRMTGANGVSNITNITTPTVSGCERPTINATLFVDQAAGSTSFLQGIGDGYLTVYWIIGSNDGSYVQSQTSFTSPQPPTVTPATGDIWLNCGISYTFDVSNHTSDELTSPLTTYVVDSGDSRTDNIGAQYQRHAAIPTDATIIGYLMYFNTTDATGGAATQSSPGGIANNPPIICTFNFTFPAHFSQRVIGPKRIITWSNVGDNQNIIVKGSSNVQAIARTEITPFKHPDLPTLDSPKIFTLLQLIYDSESTEIARKLYTLSEYQHLRVNALMNPMDFLKDVITHMTPQERQKASATGFLTWLGDSVGSLLPMQIRGIPIRPWAKKGLHWLGNKGDSYFERKMRGRAAGHLHNYEQVCEDAYANKMHRAEAGGYLTEN